MIIVFLESIVILTHVIHIANRIRLRYLLSTSWLYTLPFCHQPSLLWQSRVACYGGCEARREYLTLCGNKLKTYQIWCGLTPIYDEKLVIRYLV